MNLQFGAVKPSQLKPGTQLRDAHTGTKTYQVIDVLPTGQGVSLGTYEQPAPQGNILRAQQSLYSPAVKDVQTVVLYTRDGVTGIPKVLAVPATEEVGIPALDLKA